MSEADRYACSFSMNEDDWFRKNQRMLLGIANTKFGRELLCIPQEYPQIILIKKNCVHCLISDDGTTSTVVADFRIGAKFANVIRYRWKQFNSYAKYFQLKGWQEIGKSPYILGDRVCALTLTAYPDPNIETSTVDGYSGHSERSDASWATARSASGSLSDDSSTSLLLTQLRQDGTYTDLFRGFALFDSSSLTSSATTSAATLSVYGLSKTNTWAISPDANVFSSNPASNTAIVNADKTTVGTTAYCNTSISYASFSTTGYNDWAFNATGLSAVSKTGVSKFSIYNKQYDADNSAPTISGGTSSCNLYGVSADTSGTSTDPKLVVTYTLSSARSNFLLLSIS